MKNTKEVKDYKESLIDAIRFLLEKDKAGVVTANTILHKLEHDEL